MSDPRTTVVTLRYGLTVNGVQHLDAEIREATVADLFAAESDVPPNKPITFAAAMLAQQLVRIGEYNGPFTLGLIAKLKPSDLERLQEARLKVNEEGEGEQPG